MRIKAFALGAFMLAALPAYAGTLDVSVGYNTICLPQGDLARAIALGRDRGYPLPEGKKVLERIAGPMLPDDLYVLQHVYDYPAETPDYVQAWEIERCLAALEDAKAREQATASDAANRILEIPREVPKP